MTNLFIAIEVPMVAGAYLAHLQPPPTTGVRLVVPTQMHVTLHYVGAANLAALAAVLQPVIVAPFTLDFEGVGRFSSADSSTTLWAGVRASSELLGLHEQIAAVLQRNGHRLETRPYSPHVTLARCGPAVAAEVVTDFLARNADFRCPGVAVAGFGLYSSTMTNSVPVYTLEQHFPFLVNRS